MARHSEKLLQEIRDFLSDGSSGGATEGTLQNVETNTEEIANNTAKGSSSSTSSVASSTSSINLLSANSNRIKAVIFNDSTSSTLYVKEGSTASLSDWSYPLMSGEGVVIDDYNGIIDGIWDSVDGNARITETVV